jgi:hypothetical protein
MKGGNSDNNRSDLDKGNILKSTFDTLMEEGRKPFLSHCEVTRHGTVLNDTFTMRHGTVLKDTTPTVFNKPEVIPEVRPNPSPSRNDIHLMIDSALERHAKSIDELLRRLIEERDRKKYDVTSFNPSSTYTVSFTQTNANTSGPLAGDTSMPNPSSQSVNHFHSRTTIEGLAPTFGMP